MTDPTKSAAFNEAHADLNMNDLTNYLTLPNSNGTAMSPEAAAAFASGVINVSTLAPNFPISTTQIFSIGVSAKRTTTEMVREMMSAFGQDAATVPTWPSSADYRLRVRLDVEETMEKFHLGYYHGDAVQILDGSCDADVVMTGADLTFGFDHEAAVAEVHRSNMTKLVNGKPVKDAGGKVIKPPTYSPANLLPFVGDLATTKPDYDTREIVRDEFTKALAKRIGMVDWQLLVSELFKIMNAKPSVSEALASEQCKALEQLKSIHETVDLHVNIPEM